MTVPVTDLHLEELEHLDFHPACNWPHRECGDQPARFLIHDVICSCGSLGEDDFFICLAEWLFVGEAGLYCADCAREFTRDEAWVIVQVID